MEEFYFIYLVVVLYVVFMVLGMIVLVVFRGDVVIRVVVVCLIFLFCCRFGWVCGREKIGLRVGVLELKEFGLEF